MRTDAFFRKLSAVLICMACICGFVIPVCAQTPDPALYEGLGSDYIYIYDTDSGQVLCEKNPEDRMYPASMTKILTAIVAMEKLSDPDKIVEITEEMTAGLVEQGASLAGFGAGDRVTVEDLFYGAALPSGADASNALAILSAGSLKNFIAMMNSKAQEIGMTNSHFTNCTGLHDDDHYSTAKDMALLLNYCIKNEIFCEVFSARQYTSTPTYYYTNGIDMRSTTWSSAANNGLTLPDLIGSKTGFTYEAGHCLAYWAEFNGMKIVGVNAHCDETNMYAHGHLSDADTLLRRLHDYEKTTIVEAGQLLDTLTIHYSDHDETVNITSDETMILDMLTGDDPLITSTLPSEVTAGLRNSEVTGVIRIEKDGNLMFEKGIRVTIPKEVKFFARLKMRFESIFNKNGKK